MKILVVGSINMDLTTYVDKLPLQGETKFGNSFIQCPGGKGAYSHQKGHGRRLFSLLYWHTYNL